MVKAAEAAGLETGALGFVARYGLVRYTPVLGRKYSRGGVCEICGRTPELGKPYLLFDHCHDHGWTRGLICNWCNDQLGFFENGQVSRPAFHARLIPRLEEYRRNCPDCRCGAVNLPAITREK